MKRYKMYKKIIVITLIITMIIFFVIINNKPSENKRDRTTKIEIRQLYNALELFKFEHKRYPTKNEGLQIILKPDYVNCEEYFYYKQGLGSDNVLDKFEYYLDAKDGNPIIKLK
ncbi:MAG: type II secretion system protein GspG [Saccharospirillaceae bacterium]|nr:type II secretion system protein GspG [Pseudomonadales bacterium]NRB80393.1 type II secretion system protein GspG [Saccharospirillaceae bacterium]